MMTVRLLTAVAAALALVIGPALAAPPKAQRLAQNAEPQKKEAEKPTPLPYRTEILNFDHWTVTCRDFHEPGKKHVCSAQLKVAKSGSNQVLLEWTIGLNNQSKPVAVIQTLTGVLIEPGVTLTLGKAVRKMPFVSCFSTHCVASLLLDGKFVQDVERASSAEVVIQSPDGRGVKFEFPTKGFDKAYAALRQSK